MNKLALSLGLSVVAFIFVMTAIVTGSANATTAPTDGYAAVWQADDETTPTPSPSPTPLENDFEAGEARAIAAATDTAYSPEIEEPLEFDEFPVELLFEEFYARFDMRRGWVMTDKLLSLDGVEVVMEGYVAPPLKARIDFIILTEVQLSLCPFCSTDADWPDQIALVYLPEPDIISTEYPVRVVGRLEVGSQMDLETGMVSLVRIYAEEIEAITDYYAK